MRFVLTFHTTHDALAAAAALAGAGIPHEKIPTPRVLSSECGFAVQAGPVGETNLHALISNRTLTCAAVYRIGTVKATTTYTKCDGGNAA